MFSQHFFRFCVTMSPTSVGGHFLQQCFERCENDENVGLARDVQKNFALDQRILSTRIVFALKLSLTRTGCPGFTEESKTLRCVFGCF